MAEGDRLPRRGVDDGATLAIGELRIRAHELGPCESASEALYIVQGPDDDAPVAFTGDLFYNAHHSYNADGFTGAWLDALDRARDLLAGIDTLYPGHGRPAGLAALDAQRRYQLMLREAVRNLAHGEPSLSDAAKAELTARMSAFLPDPALEWLVALERRRRRRRARSRTAVRQHVKRPLYSPKGAPGGSPPRLLRRAGRGARTSRGPRPGSTSSSRR